MGESDSANQKILKYLGNSKFSSFQA